MNSLEGPKELPETTTLAIEVMALVGSLVAGLRRLVKGTIGTSPERNKLLADAKTISNTLRKGDKIKYPDLLDGIEIPLTPGEKQILEEEIIFRSLSVIKSPIEKLSICIISIDTDSEGIRTVHVQYDIQLEDNGQIKDRESFIPLPARA